MTGSCATTWDALNAAGKALRAFVQLYLPFHGLKDDVFFARLGLWTLIEARIYEADELNEGSGAWDEVVRRLWSVKEMLGVCGFVGPWTEGELMNGQLYFALERRYRHEGLSLNELFAAARARSFDLRLLHRLLFELHRWPFDAPLFATFGVFEQIMELDDDRKSQVKDREKHSFNIVVGLAELDSVVSNTYINELREGAVTGCTRLGNRWDAMLLRYCSLVDESILRE